MYPAPSWHDASLEELKEEERRNGGAPFSRPAQTNYTRPDPTLETLAAGLVSGSLVKAADLDRVMARFGHPPTVEDLLAELAGARLLTNYQAGVLAHTPTTDLFLLDYVLTDVLAESPRATVYRAVHRGRPEQVAIKVSSQADVRLADLQAAARLKHPRLAPVLKVIRHGNLVCQVMPYFEHGDLGRRVRRLGRLSVSEALEHVRSAAEAMHYAGKHGLAHGALGTSNLLLDAKGRALVSDLCWAPLPNEASADEDEDDSSSTSGLPEGNDLSAPELIGGSRAPDQVSDVYSLGATLFFLVTGVPPKWDKRLGTVPVLADFVRDLPGGLQHVFSRMVAHDRKQRYATFKQVLRAVADLAAAEAADLAPVPEEEPAPRKDIPFYQRPGAALTLVLVLLGGLFVGFGVVLGIQGVAAAVLNPTQLLLAGVNMLLGSWCLVRAWRFLND